MNLATTTIILNPPTAFNSIANNCLTFAQELFGGREIIVIDNDITVRELQAGSYPFYITVLKVVSCIILVPLGVACRLLSCFNPDVRRAFSYTPVPVVSQGEGLSQTSDKIIETLKIEPIPQEIPTPPPSPSQKEESTPTPDTKAVSQGEELIQISDKIIETLKIKPIPQEIPTSLVSPSQKEESTPTTDTKVETPKTESIPSPEKVNNVRSLAPNPNKTTSKYLLSLISQKQYHLLSQFTNHEIEIIEDSDVITLVKSSLRNNSSFLAEKLINNEKYSRRTTLSEIDEDFLDAAMKAKHQKISEWILARRPFLALTVRSGLPYLELIYKSQDPEIVEFLENPFKDEPLSKSTAFYLDQLYTHIPHALLFSETELTEGLEIYKDHLGRFSNAFPKRSFLKTWVKKEESILPVFEELNKKEIHNFEIQAICSIHGNLLKQAFVYLEYLGLDTDGDKSETSKELLRIYPRLIEQLQWARVKVPTSTGKELFKRHAFAQLKEAISQSS